MKENSRLKYDLVAQSFAPVFLLPCIKHAHCYWIYWEPFINGLKAEKFIAVSDVIHHPFIGDFFIFMISFIWIIWAILVYLGFVGTFRVNFDSRGERIIVLSDKRDSGATFLVSFVLPLLVDDVSTLRGFVAFIVLLILMILLLIRSNLFYQNPVLTILGYRVFEFKFVNPYGDIKKADGCYIGITKGKVITEEQNIKRKYIADDVFIIFNV